MVNLDVWSIINSSLVRVAGVHWYSVQVFPTKSVGLVNFPTKYTAPSSHTDSSLVDTLDMLDTETHWGMYLYHDNIGDNTTQTFDTSIKVKNKNQLSYLICYTGHCKISSALQSSPTDDFFGIILLL